ncbi:HoxN/HupN/NixA family nickel/cobalt transporter [Burkholderia dolosa]|uniref:Nickel/cobalt efflux system n=1 Tax=Burkholderia dolosa TaxID=152500 RepID=A0A892IHQ7_9BURK|nr:MULTISPECIES: HoxN/HupN/NixA family nickel/cobalt transporter [Burkholderia]AJY11542.1 transition metal uptake transporter, Ni2+-Co2+ transporter family protein [Burkholderia dolosa AU0158]AYZ95861.1 HoxN/HupN/NixA family nickel/cobalt transporter [Burkholderia dolosa]ETP61459.1 nickel transporter [Burkholderia dolosa PC543]MBR8418810.1 HoxN/HupN/NixA family nickel/cobalt transporter [Burkholderia dolosa]MBR8457986.1 HoxN/HupN/NixA family nickel/cobalt transporter [Burkholderia dolosa]
MLARRHLPPATGVAPAAHARVRSIDLSALWIVAFIVLLHVVGWGTLIALIVPQHLSVGSRAFGIGAGITAYSLGMRHAFDADHIAAIDNTTRKLLGEGQRSASVGFWFSFGHSSVVFGLAVLISLGMHSVSTHVVDAGSTLRALTSVLGATVSSVFLYAIAALNVAAFYDLYRAFRAMRTGRFDEAQLERRLESRGIVARVLAPLMRIVRKPAQMYFVGLLFGLGFDTATEIALLVLTGSGAASGLPWYAILCLPVLFAAGMLLFDTIDGSFMHVAYGWALARPVRKIYYNLVVTGLSIGVALVIGTIEMLGLLNHALGMHGAFGAWLSALDLNDVGFAIVGLFVATWAISVAIWKFGRIEQRWAAGPDA